MINHASEFQKLKYDTLKYFWGYNSFRDSQEDIIDSIIQGKDTLALLPTGAGKSMCYQLPALLLEGTCIVISPLLALMKNQVSQLKLNGIEAEYLSSELEDIEAEIILNRCKDGFTKLLYISPERTTNPYFLQNLDEINVSFIAIDEAHCISEWGQDFRPSYQNIKGFRERLVQIPCIALTATATPKVLEEIQLKLGLKSAQIFQKSFQRTNLKISIEEIADKYQKILDFLRFNNQSGIIYTRTRKDAEQLCEFLQNKDIRNVDYFHAGLSPKDKHFKQNKWLQSPNQVLISTNAFGMGIDKDDVRFVIHFSPPQSIENYYQEIGRAGRDGSDSYTLMLWNEQELKNIDDIFSNQIPNKTEFHKIISSLYSIFQVADLDQPENLFQLDIERIRNFTKCSLSKINNVLSFLHNQEIIFLKDKNSLSTLELKIPFDQIDLLSKKDAYFMELILRNLPGITNNKVYFSEKKISEKLNTDVPLLKERLREMLHKNHVDYIDGTQHSIRFIKPRDERAVNGKYWFLFEQIQKNKIQKWEEMKFFIKNNDFCKMKMILSYFGEKESKNCGKCIVCERKKENIFGNSVHKQILDVLAKKPSTIEEITIQLSFCERDKILENLILLLDSGKVKMLNFRTYTIA